MSTWFVTGGAGYVGAHVVHALRAIEDEVVAFDDLSAGQAAKIGKVRLVVGSVLDTDLVRATLADVRPHGVIHLAARKRGDESMVHPGWYYQENIGGLRSLLQAMSDVGVDRLVMSSSAAVYGDPARSPVDEDAPTRPTTPYGQTKLDGERLIRRWVRDRRRAVVLRYFNVAGAGSPQLADVGSANLLSVVLEAVASGAPPVVHGDCHPTADGTCVRDYVHPTDVAAAHVAALPLLDGPAGWHVLNVGTGRGWSVRDVLGAVQEVTGRPVEPVVGPPRVGDPPSVVAAVDRIAAVLGWHATRDLPEMVASAWQARSCGAAGAPAAVLSGAPELRTGRGFQPSAGPDDRVRDPS
jgi:UDP-glucose 4-epimerase